MIDLWLPHRSPHHGRALVPAAVALARYSAPMHLARGVARAQDAAGEGEQEHDDQDSDEAAHSLQMAGQHASDREICAACANEGIA